MLVKPCLYVQVLNNNIQNVTTSMVSIVTATTRGPDIYHNKRTTMTGCLTRIVKLLQSKLGLVAISLEHRPCQLIPNTE